MLLFRRAASAEHVIWRRFHHMACLRLIPRMVEDVILYHHLLFFQSHFPLLGPV